jgi:Cytochrome c554 and c-prime
MSRKAAWILFATMLLIEAYLGRGAHLFANDEFLGSQKCASCHSDIASVQLTSEHARTLRKMKAVPELLKALPLHFSDRAKAVEYRLEKSTLDASGLDLVASKDGSTERLQLIWAFGAGRKGMTFVGRSSSGEYGQGRVSWYERINALDITTGGDQEPVRVAHDALGQWLSQKEREECFGCHVTRQAEALPELIEESNAGVQCERCHGPGQKHVEAMTLGKTQQGLAIRNPGKFGAAEQLEFCGVCHRAPLANLSEAVPDSRTIRFPAQRLVLSLCYDESDGKLKCTTCHNPHENLQESPAYYDQKCQSCHAGSRSMGSRCPVSGKDCVTCHMPRVPLMKHSDFADHWIRKIKPAAR